jgi:hypothetical protein
VICRSLPVLNIVPVLQYVGLPCGVQARAGGRPVSSDLAILQLAEPIIVRQVRTVQIKCLLVFCSCKRSAVGYCSRASVASGRKGCRRQLVNVSNGARTDEGQLQCAYANNMVFHLFTPTPRHLSLAGLGISVQHQL